MVRRFKALPYQAIRIDRLQLQTRLNVPLLRISSVRKLSSSRGSLPMVIRVSSVRADFSQYGDNFTYFQVIVYDRFVS